MRKRSVYCPVLVALWIVMTSHELFTQDHAVLHDHGLTLNSLPLVFEPNEGQADAKVRFLARGGSYGALLESNKTMLINPRGTNTREGTLDNPSFVTLELLNSSTQATAEGLELLTGKSNYYVGNQRTKWLSGISQYGKVKFSSVYSGFDLIFYGGESGLEYDFVLCAGAHLENIVFRITGADKVELDDSGNLSLHSASEQMGLRRPTIYQDIAGVRREVAGRFVMRGDNEVGFSIGDYNHTRARVVDPVLSYSTLIGANNSVQVQGVAVNSAGEIYVTGTTFSTNYPVVNPFQSTTEAPPMFSSPS